jgi:hypothetical protein
VIARQLDIPLHDINSSEVPLYLRDGSQLDTNIDMQVMGLNVAVLQLRSSSCLCYVWAAVWGQVVTVRSVYEADCCMSCDQQQPGSCWCWPHLCLLQSS